MTRVLTTEVQNVPPETLLEHPQNPNRGNVDAIKSSIEANGFYGALVVQSSTRHILSGNHRWKAARELNLPTVPVLFVDVDDERALRILIADNRTSELAYRDNESLLALLDELKETENGLDGVAYSLAEVEELRQSLEQELTSFSSEEPDRDEPTPKQLFELVDVTAREPKQKVHHGEVYRLGQSLTLIVANPVTEMKLIEPYFSTDCLFLPFAGGFIGFLETNRPCVIAQPNHYIAAFIIDRYREAFGDAHVAQIQ